MSTKLLLQVVGWLSLPVLAVLAGILIWRKVRNKFPHFFNYVVVTEVVGVVRLWAYYAKPRAYAPVYWLSDLLIALFALLATYELFVKRLFPRFSAVRFYRYLFPIATAIVAIFAALAAIETRKFSNLLPMIHVFDVLRVTM